MMVASVSAGEILWLCF